MIYFGDQAIFLGTRRRFFPKRCICLDYHHSTVWLNSMPLWNWLRLKITGHSGRYRQQIKGYD